MKRIINPWVGKTERYNCFGCCPSNPRGAHMSFYWDGEQVVSVWRADPNFVSWIDTLHGGIQATLLDEICGWVVFYQLQTSCVTAKMEMRYRKPVSTLWPYVRLNARLVEQRNKFVVIHGEILSPDGVCCAECNCTYFVYTGEKSVEMGYMPAVLDDVEVTFEEAVALLGKQSN